MKDVIEEMHSSDPCSIPGHPPCASVQTNPLALRTVGGLPLVVNATG